MRHVTLLRCVTLTCNIKITNVTPKKLNNILVPMLSTLGHSYILAFYACMWSFYCGIAFKSVVLEQKVILTLLHITLLCCIRELRHIRSLSLLKIASFDQFDMYTHFISQYHGPKGDLLAIPKLQTACFYHRNVRVISC